MRNHLQSILHTSAIFGAVGMIFLAVAATRHWAAQDKHLDAETAFFHEQVEAKRGLFSDAKKAETEGQKQQALALAAAIRAEQLAQAQRQKEEKENKDYEQKVAVILRNMEIGRRICIHAHQETWWFVCYTQDDKGYEVPNSEEPCEHKTWVCNEWAVKKGLERKGEKTWGNSATTP